MRYMLLICIDESVEVRPEDHQAVEPWLAEMEQRGIRLMGSQLRPSGDATAVRVRDQELMITDGPFAEAKEQLAGFDLIDCRDLDEAIEVASRHPVARFGTIEIRPLAEE